MNTDLKVFINKIHNSSLAFENEQYVFRYKEFAKDIVSLTMPIRNTHDISF